VRRAGAAWLALVGVGVAAVAAADPARSGDDGRDQAEIDDEAGPPGEAADAPPAIELYTMGVGEEWVERFGHSAMCVRWAAPRRTRCYNYGTTDFDHVGPMVWNFLRGRSTFWVSTSSLPSLLQAYTDLDRTVWVQRIPLAPDQARAIARGLAHDALPANRYYRYHHFEDNCTTRLRDFLDRATDGALSREARGSYPALRDLARAGWAGEPPLLHLSDLFVGRRVDRLPTPHEAMFLPLVLRDQVEAVFGVAPELVYARQGPAIPQTPGGRAPIWIAVVLLLAPLGIATLAGGRGRTAALVWALAPCVLLGVVLWAMLAICRVPELRWNELALLLLAGPRRWRRGYARGRVVQLLAVAALAALGVLRQPLLPFVLVPLAAAWVVARAIGSAPAPPRDLGDRREPERAEQQGEGELPG
jgi:hypothetical protein